MFISNEIVSQRAPPPRCRPTRNGVRIRTPSSGGAPHRRQSASQNWNGGNDGGRPGRKDREWQNKSEAGSERRKETELRRRTANVRRLGHPATSRPRERPRD